MPNSGDDAEQLKLLHFAVVLKNASTVSKVRKSLAVSYKKVIYL